MTYIKKIVMQGFKSFPRRTEIPFENSMNVIVGPNGSGKSNIVDALCFVLGRLSIKSIRAAKAANLIFSGNKMYKGSSEAFVELTFDNEDRTFDIDKKEIHIKRIVRKNGQSIYKINGETKTRQELIELLSKAGIDPYGFNIILQGEIQSLVKANSEERRKIIEEVAGISVYETRKKKSLRELEKTEEKLKEANAILRERTNYLRNLNKERQEALLYTKLENLIKRCKATILSKNISKNRKKMFELDESDKNHRKEIGNLRKVINEKKSKIDELKKNIEIVNKNLHSSTGKEQETLHREISDLKAELAGHAVRSENLHNRIKLGKDRIARLKNKIKNLEKEISEFKVKSPEIKKQQQKQKAIQDKLDALETQKREFYNLKAELSGFSNKLEEKERLLLELKKDKQIIENSLESLKEGLLHAQNFEELANIKARTKKEIEKITDELVLFKEEILKKEKRNAVLEEELKREEDLINKILRLKSCPVCLQEVCEDHKTKIKDKSDKIIKNSKKEIKENKKILSELLAKVSRYEVELSKKRKIMGEIDMDELKLNNIKDKLKSSKEISEDIDKIQREIKQLNNKIRLTKTKLSSLREIEEKYYEARLTLSDFISLNIDVDSEVKVKQREINQLKIELKSTITDVEESQMELNKINSIIDNKQKTLLKKEKDERELYEKFRKLFNERNELIDHQKAVETEIIGLDHSIRSIEEKINYNKIQRAQLIAQIESMEAELKEIGDFKPMTGSEEEIKEKLIKSQFRISKIGNVNLRSLDAYKKVEEQCKNIKEKIATIVDEKNEILKIIEKIDKTKKKIFMKTLSSINEIFSRNFRMLSKKGDAFLELENKKNPFEGGLDIIIKVGKGKYFDVNSLSGGEKTLIALSLIFAIQEYEPYAFYILDEIDAALDKHNSELLAGLIKKYMNTGQYIIITHNDSLITEAVNLYGVSMQDNISKVVSLKV